VACQPVASLIWPSCDRKIDNVEPAEDTRQDGPQDRPAKVPRTDHRDHRAETDPITNDANGTAAGKGLEDDFSEQQYWSCSYL
jgi:hypothetical protein